MPARAINKQYISALLSAATALVNGAGRGSFSSTAAPALQIRLNSTVPRWRDNITANSWTAGHNAISNTTVASWNARLAVAFSSSSLSPGSTRYLATGKVMSAVLIMYSYS